MTTGVLFFAMPYNAITLKGYIKLFQTPCTRIEDELNLIFPKQKYQLKYFEPLAATVNVLKKVFIYSHFF